MRIRTDEVLHCLWRAKGIDPGNALIGYANARHARVAITTAGRAEITTDLDPRGLSEGVVLYLNPYSGAYSVMDYASADDLLNDKKIHARLENFLNGLKTGDGAINTSTLGYLVGTDEAGLKTPMR